MLLLNSRLCALVATGVSLLVAPGLRAQTPDAAPSAIRGDVDGDGRVTRADADAVRTYLVRGTLPAGRSILPAGDANGDGRVTAADAALISRFAAGVDVSRFPVGKPVGGHGGGRQGEAAVITTDYQCIVDLSTETTNCQVVARTGPDGARLDVIAGTPQLTFKGSWVHSRGSTVDEDTSINTLAFVNNMGQPIGTADGTTPHPDGNRLFFSTIPFVNSVYSGTIPGSSIQLVTPDGVASFNNPEGTSPFPDRPYYQYDGIVAPGDTSTSRAIRYIYSSNLKSFGYGYRVSTPVQYEYGWIEISPATSPVLAVGDSATLSGTVYNAFGVVQSNDIEWTSSNAGVATVGLSTGVVKGVAPGTVTITATSSGVPQRTATREITVDAAPTVTGTVPADGAAGVAPGSDIVVTFSEAVDVSTSSFALECPVGSAQAFTVGGSGTNTITVNPDGNLPAATTCTVTVVAAQVSDSDANDGPDLMAADTTFSFDVAIVANADTLTSPVVGNVAVNTANLASPFSVTENDDLNEGATISFAGWSGTSGATEQGGNVTITPSGDGMGQFTYDPPAGYEGPDSFDYIVQSGAAADTATVSLNVEGMIWFVHPDSAACDPMANSNCGRLSRPFKTLAEFSSINDGTGNNPEDGESVFLYEGTHLDAVTLRTGQKLIGQDATASLETLAEVDFPDETKVPSTNSGNAAKVTLTGSDGVNLAQNNALYGLTLQTSGGQAIGSTGGGFGTLTLAAAGNADVTINSGGQALALSTGTLSGAFASVTSTGGTNNVSLVGVGTTGTADLGSGALSGASGDAFVITNGAGSFTYAGTISNATSRTVNVSGKSAGTVTLSGNINPVAAGTGISVSGNTGGTVTFSGTKNISSGTAAGVSLTSNTGATIAFTNGGLTVASTTGVPFTATGGGTVEVSGAGNTIAVSGAAANAVNLNGITLAAGGMSFSTISSNGVTTGSAFSATSVTGGSFTAGSLTVAGTTGGTSRGIALITNSAPFTFTTASVNGTGAEGIFLSGNTGAVSVSGGSVGNSASPAGDALSISGGNAAVTVAATLTKSSAGRIANIANHTSGAVTISGALSCTGSCTGILANANGGTLDFTSVTKTLTTGASAAVTLTGNTGTIGFTNGGLVINTTSGAGFSASGGGTVNVEGTTNTVTSTTGTAVSISSTTIGSNGVRFRSVSANGAPNGIFLSTTGNTGGQFLVTGDGSTVGSGGTIVNTSGGDGATSGNGIYLNGVRNVNLSWMALSGHSNNGLFGTGVTGLSLNKMRFTGIHGTSNSGTFEESPVHLVASGGAISVRNSRLDGGAWNGFLLRNTSGSASVVDSLVLDTDTVSTMQGSTADVRNTGLQAIIGDGTADVRMRNNRVTFWWGNALQVLVQGTGSATARITNNLLNQTSGALAAAGGIQVGGGNLSFNVSSNTINGTNGTAISADRGSAGAFNGTINGNFIGTSGVANSGSAAGTGIFAQHAGPGVTTINVTNNTIRQINGTQAIWMLLGDDVGGGGSGTMNTTITGNNIAEEGTAASARTGIVIQSGRVPGDTDEMCADVGGAGALANTITNFNNRIRPNERFLTTMRLRGYSGANNDNTAVQNYLTARNPGTVNVASNNVSAGGPGILNTTPAGSACPQPAL